MNLAIIGGVSATKMTSILNQSADNVSVVPYKSFQEFIEQTSLRTTPLDRLFIMQDAYLANNSDAHMQLENLMHYVWNQFPELRVIALGTTEDVLSAFAEVIVSDLALTISIQRVSAKFITDLATLPLDNIRRDYANNIFASNINAIAEEATLNKPETKAAPADQKKQKKGGLFGFGGKSKKSSSFSAGTSPAAPLTQGQSQGFGANPQNPSGSFGANSGNTNPFGGTANTNPFASPDTGNVNPFGGSETTTANSGAVDAANTNPWANDNASSTVDEVVTAGPALPQPVDFSNYLGSSNSSNADAAPAFPDMPQQSFDTQQGFSETNDAWGNMSADFGMEGGAAPKSGSNFDSVEEFNPAAAAPAFVGAADFMQSPTSTPAASQNPIAMGTSPADVEHASSLDMSRLSAGHKAANYDFSDASKMSLATRRSNTPAVEEVASIAPAPNMGIIDDSAYREQFTPAPKVVERVVERQVYVDSGTETPAQTLLDAGKHVTIIVTGDRRSGVTYTCLSLAAMYAKRYSTLLVDLDTETCGGQLYQDIEVLNNEEENIKCGVLRAKSPTLLSNLVHHDVDDGFDYLFSLVGNPQPTDLDLQGLQSALLAQNRYQLTIIDCPWSRLRYVSELCASKAKIMLCVDANITGCHNTVELLNDLPVGDRFLLALDRAGGYVARGGTGLANLQRNMAWLADLFETGERDWAELRILGEADKGGLLEIMKKL